MVKPSEITPSTTVILGELLMEAGLPAGVVNIVLGYGQPVGALMTTDPRVDMVTFTGSTGVGKAIVAAAAPTLKKVSLELGGKNPQVMFPDADLDAPSMPSSSASISTPASAAIPAHASSCMRISPRR